MDRTGQVPLGKRDRLIAELTERIRSGQLAPGERLPGEKHIAEEYHVSRGTVRSALSELQRQDLIATRTGIGSFVTFDGVTLDQGIGWATALAQGGFDISTEDLGITTVPDAALTERFGIEQFISVRRLRRDRVSGPVSLETSLLPAIGELATLPERGLVDDSITATLHSAGLRSREGEQHIGMLPVPPEIAELLECEVGERFLHAVRLSIDAAGQFVEQVTSVLDPDRFQFRLTFGPR